MVQKKNQKNEKQKSAKEIKKELEDKTFGMKNKKKSRDLKKQIDKINTNVMLEKKKNQIRDAAAIKLVQPKPGIGVDPKTIQCVYFLNKMCTKGDKCKFGHEKKQVEVVKEVVPTTKLVCRFLLDAMNDNSYSKNWVCPDVKCRDIHKLVEIGDVEISLEEYIELSRHTLGEKLTPLTEETFNEWKINKKKEEERHAAKVKAMKEGLTGGSLFKERPDMFVDDDEGEDIDYKAREEEVSDEDLEVKVGNMEL